MSLPQFGYSIPHTAISSSQLLGMSSTTAPAIPSISTSCCENGRPIMTDPHTGQSICSCQYGSGLLSAYSRVPGLPESVYSASPYGSQGYMPLGTDPSAFYSPLNAHYDLKDNAEAWRNLTQPAACYPYDAAMAAYPYGNAYGGMDLNGAARRKNATRETTNTLKAWLYEHRKNPYPTKGEKIMLAIITKMTLTQVSTWFANARRRLKKENKMTWSPRNRCGDGEDDDKDKSGDEDDDCQKEKKDEDNDMDKDCLKDDDSVIDSVIGEAKDVCNTTGGIDVISALDTSNEDSRVPTTSLSPSGPTILHQPKRLNSPCSNSSDSGLSDANGTLTMNGNSFDHNEATRPRIWSLAHVATSVSATSSSTTESKEQTSPLNFSKIGNPFMSQPGSMRPWLDGTLSAAASVFPTMSGAYGSLVSHRPRDTTTVTSALNGLPGFSTSSILRPYPQISSMYSSRDNANSSLIS